jgi:hypothetical protein
VAKAPNLPIELRHIFFKAVAAFPNIRFVWKWDGEKPEKNYPANLLLVDWVNQQDILGNLVCIN